MKLGRRPHDPAAVARAPQLAGHMRAVLPPPRLDRSHVPFTPGLDRNDTISDCAEVAYANCARLAAVLSGFQIAISTGEVVDFYSAATGYMPGDPSTDRGSVLLDVLGHQLRAGFSRVDHEPLVANFGAFDPRDRAMMATVLARIGPVVLGVDLAEADMQADAGDPSVVWSTASSGDQTPDPQRGHGLFALDYTGLADTDIVRVGTWGFWKPVTWAWLQSRTVEAYALIFRQLMRADGKNFFDLDYDGLHATNVAWAA